MADPDSDTRPISMSVTGPEPIVLPAEPDAARAAVAAADGAADRLDALRRAAASHPRSLFAWAALGDAEADTTIRYACYRVGYHRGLDALRGNGWRGAGEVSWSEPTNRGFLRALLGLHLMSRVIEPSNSSTNSIVAVHHRKRSTRSCRDESPPGRCDPHRRCEPPDGT
jgi:hypothetical protein